MNYVGVDLNTASPSLLRYVSGLNQLTAQRIYDYRMAQRAV
ncbi:MAG: helix-hairpin-helix domain-containing protein [Pirellulales bacterium]